MASRLTCGTLMDWKISDDIPVPTVGYRGGRTSKSVYLPLDKLELGQSILVPFNMFTHYFRLANRLHQAGARLERCFHYRTRNMHEHGEEGWRIWRVS